MEGWAAGSVRGLQVPPPAPPCSRAAAADAHAPPRHSWVQAEQFAAEYPKVQLKVNGRAVEVPEGASILTACQQAGAYVSAPPACCCSPCLPSCWGC